MAEKEQKKLVSVFPGTIAQMAEASIYTDTVNKDNALQRANLTNRTHVNSILDRLLLEGSAIHGFDELEALYELNKQGKSCLLLLEHYSNFDLPSLFYLAEKQRPKDPELLNSIVAMATRKLNEHNKYVRAFAEAYTRVAVFAARTLEDIAKDKDRKEEWRQAMEYNKFALMEMNRLQRNSHIILIFPSGTRYRPGKPETKRPIEQIDSFIKRFDYMIFGGIAGIVLEVDQEGRMAEELIKRDVISFFLGPVHSCEEFRKNVLSSGADQADERKLIANAVFAELSTKHAEAKQKYDEAFQKLGDVDVFDV